MPTSVVVDASVAVKWFYETRERNITEATEVLKTICRKEVRLVVPDIFFYELGNVFANDKALAAERVKEHAGLFFSWESEIVVMTEKRFLSISSIAQRHQLTLYDAAYFAVAEEYGIDLITEDKALLATRAQFVKSLRDFH